MEKNRGQQVSLRLPASFLEQIDELKDKMDPRRSRMALIREALKYGLSHLVKLERERSKS